MTNPTLPEQSSGPSTHHNLQLATRPRSLLIDVVRGLAITLVALGHTNQGVAHRGWWGASTVGTRLGLAIYAFHMPAFFFITGIFLNASLDKRGTRRFLRDKLRSILWPYLLFSCLTALTELLLSRFMTQQPPSLHTFLVAVATGGYGWFLPTIFCAILLATLSRAVPAPLFFLATAALATWYPFAPVPILTAALKLLPFLVLGIWVGRSYLHFEQLPRRIAALAAVALGLLILATTPHIPDLHASLLYVPLGILGTLLLLLVARVLARTRAARAFAWIGEASFGIFLLAAYPQGATRELLLRLHHLTNPYAQLLLPTALAVTLPAVLYHQRVRLHIAWMFVFPG